MISRCPDRVVCLSYSWQQREQYSAVLLRLAWVLSSIINLQRSPPCFVWCSLQADAASVLQISLLNAEHNSQLMLLGARNLTLLADVLPTICSSIVRHGAVPALCARLMTIEYIDLAEQSLQACSCLVQLGNLRLHTVGMFMVVAPTCPQLSTRRAPVFIILVAPACQLVNLV